MRTGLVQITQEWHKSVPGKSPGCPSPGPVRTTRRVQSRLCSRVLGSQRFRTELLPPASHRQTQAQATDQAAQLQAEVQEEDDWTASTKASAAHQVPEHQPHWPYEPRCFCFHHLPIPIIGNGVPGEICSILWMQARLLTGTEFFASKVRIWVLVASHSSEMNRTHASEKHLAMPESVWEGFIALQP